MALDASADERDTRGFISITTMRPSSGSRPTARSIRRSRRRSRAARDRAVAHDLVFLVGQRQGRGDGDAVAGVHAHRIDVFDGADDDAVVRRVADHFHLDILSSPAGFLDQDLGIGEAPARAQICSIFSRL